MGILFGTDDGVWKIDNGTEERIGLVGKSVCHVADRGTSVLAAVPRDGLYEISGPDDRLIWEGDARACAVGPDDRLYVGMEPAMVFRSEDRGQTWSRSDGIDQLPTRDEWYFPSPPHKPHPASRAPRPLHGLSSQRSRQSACRSRSGGRPALSGLRRQLERAQ